MEELMRMIFGFLTAAAGVYSILIFIRIIISWFGGSVYGKPVDILNAVTDPYLDWWKRTLNLRIGFLDFSVLAAIAFISVLQSVFFSLSRYEMITLGRILAIVLMSFWNVVSFILGFCFLVIVLRLIAYLTSRNIYSPFWQAVDSVSQPVLYRLNRIMFGNKIAGYLKGIILSLLLLAVIMIGGKIVMPLFASVLFRLPI
jgi:YggT family protein